MMGRQILGAIPVERRVLLFAAVDVAGHPQLEDKTVGDAFRPGSWRVLALDRTPREERREDPAVEESYEDNRAGDGASGWEWDLPDTQVLQKNDRVVLAATRRGLAELLGRRSRERAGA